MLQWRDVQHWKSHFEAWQRHSFGYNKVGLWKVLHRVSSLQLSPSFPPFPKANIYTRGERRSERLATRNIEKKLHGNTDCTGTDVECVHQVKAKCYVAALLHSVSITRCIQQGKRKKFQPQNIQSNFKRSLTDESGPFQKKYWFTECIYNKLFMYHEQRSCTKTSPNHIRHDSFPSTACTVSS